jgi:competence protein ComEA
MEVNNSKDRTMKKLNAMIWAGVLACLSFTLSAVPYNDESTVTQTIQVVHINQAGVAELSTLKGIGLKKAQAIVEFRQQNGKFQLVEDLLKVKGIGENIIKENLSRIKI